MGRKKLEMKRIEDKSNRNVTFSKRRGGLMKKAREISILCDVEVGLVIFSGRGKVYEFCSRGSLLNIIERYKSYLEGGNQSLIDIHTKLATKEKTTNKKERKCKNSESNEESLVSSLGKLLQTIQSQIEESNVEKFNPTDLMQLENQLETTLNEIKSLRIEEMIETGYLSDNTDAAFGMVYQPIDK